MKKRISGQLAAIDWWNRSTVAARPRTRRQAAAAGHREVVVPRDPEQPVAVPRAAIQVVVVRRQSAIGVEVADDGVGGQPAQEPVDVEPRLDPAPPRLAVGPRSVHDGDRVLDVGPVLVVWRWCASGSCCG